MSKRAQVIAPLLAAPGKRFFVSQIAEATGLPAQTCAMTINAACNNNSGVKIWREMSRTHSGRAYVYWVGEIKKTDQARAVAWLKKHKRAARISVIAKALGMEFYEASGLLAAMHRAGELVRCELPLGGMDCYEYRLMGAI